MLVLDEPTNHLDIPSAERLEQSLSKEGGYDGTMLLISHDRQLLQDTCDKLIILDGSGGARLFPGTYIDWEQKQREEKSAAERPVEKPRKTQRKAQPKPRAKTAAA